LPWLVETQIDIGVPISGSRYVCCIGLGHSGLWDSGDGRIVSFIDGRFHTVLRPSSEAEWHAFAARSKGLNMTRPPDHQRNATIPAMTILFQFQINAAGLLTRRR
jgi:hypothetical protein